MSLVNHISRLAVGVALLAGAVAAQAADLPSRVIAPVVPLPVPTTWTGIYIGASGGGDFMQNLFETRAVSRGFDLNGGSAVASLNDNRARAGGYIGYNYQIHDFLIGVEGDAAYDFGKRRQVNGLPGQTYVNGANVDVFSGKGYFDASARGRAGFLMFPTALFYATGGVAFRDVSYSAICAGGNLSFCATPQSQSFSSTRTGWTVGGGVEGQLTPNLIARIEYRYSDFGHQNLNFFGSPNDPAGNFFGGRTTLNASTVYAGLAYKFNVFAPAPVVARY